MKKILLISTACIALLVGGGWGYLKFATVPPPSLEKADTETLQKVVNFYGHPQGLIQLSIDQQEEYLVRAYQQFSRGESREQYIRAIERMSTGEREMLQSAVFEIVRKHVNRMAKEYRNTPPAQRGQYIENAVRNLETVRSELGGSNVAGGGNMGEPLKEGLPLRKEEFAKMLTTRTDSQERAEAEPFINAMAERYKQEKAAKRN